MKMGFSIRSFAGIVVTAVLVLAFCLTTNAQNDDATKQAIDLFQQGQDAHEKGILDEAVRLYTKALELFPEFPEAELQRGTAYLAQKKLREAEASYRRALELREGWSLAMSHLGSLLVSTKNYTEAERLLTASIAEDPASPLSLSALTELRLATNASAEVLRALLAEIAVQASKARPTASLLSSKAALELRLGDRAAAKESSFKALQIDAKLPSALAVAADIALLEKDIDRADGFVLRLEAVTPGSQEATILRARVMYSQGKRADALKLLESIAEPSSAVKELIAKAKDGDVADLAGLEAKVKRTPDDVNALAKLCDGFRVTEPAKAIDFCRRASVLEPNEISHAVGFGAALVQAKFYVEAVGLFRKLLTIDPNHSTIRANLATALFQLKRFPEAKTEFRWLAEKQPTSAAAFYFLAIIHDQIGEYLDAMAAYQQFLKLADRAKDKLEIDKVELRLPALQKLIKDGKGKKAGL